MQIFERNPLCGLHYPCGEAAHYSNTCIPLDDGHHGDDNLSNSSMDHMTGSGMTVTTMMSMLGNDSMVMDTHNVTPSFPRGFRICNQPNTALWSLILALTTFTVALLLRKLRYKNFLGKKVSSVNKTRLFDDPFPRDNGPSCLYCVVAIHWLQLHFLLLLTLFLFFSFSLPLSFPPSLPSSSLLPSLLFSFLFFWEAICIH